MGHIQDRWYKETPDPQTPGKAIRVPTAIHGKGLRYKVRYIDPDGQERSKSYPDKKLKDARAFLAKIETDKLTGDYIDPNAGKTTLREYSDNWLKGQSQDESSQRTIRSKLDKQVHPFLGAHTLSTIGTATIRDWLNWMNGNDISESHKSQVFNLLSAILSSAADEKENPDKSAQSKGNQEASARQTEGHTMDREQVTQNTARPTTSTMHRDPIRQWPWPAAG